MTTWTLSKPPVAKSPEAEVDDLLASLDAELGTPAKKERSAPKAKAVATEPAPYVQQWFPQALVCHGTRQECTCGQVWDSIDGLFLEDISRNGITRQKRHEPRTSIPAEYKALPKRQEWIETPIEYCAICFQDITEEHFAAPVLIRSLPHDPTAEKDDGIPTFEEN